MSITVLSLLVGVLVTVLNSMGVDIAEGDIETTVTTIVQIVSAIGIYYGRIRQGDVTLLGLRKK